MIGIQTSKHSILLTLGFGAFDNYSHPIRLVTADSAIEEMMMKRKKTRSDNSILKILFVIFAISIN